MINKSTHICLFTNIYKTGYALYYYYLKYNSVSAFTLLILAHETSLGG